MNTRDDLEYYLGYEVEVVRRDDDDDDDTQHCHEHGDFRDLHGQTCVCDRAARPLPLHRTEAGYPNCSTCDGGGCPDCTDPA